MRFINLNMIVPGRARYNEDTGTETVDETAKPVAVNAANIRCFYARRDAKPGTRITFNDGGGFAVTEAPDVVAQLVATGELVSLALVPSPSDASN